MGEGLKRAVAAARATRKNAAAVQLGSRGGKARAENLTDERKAEIARSGAEARWAKQKKAAK